MLSRRRLLVLATAGIGTLAGCGYRPGGGDVRWEVNTGSSAPDDLLSIGGTVFTVKRYVQGVDFDSGEWVESAHVTAYDASSGTERWDDWSAPVGRPAAHRQSLYLGHNDGTLAALDTEGKTIWNAALNDAPDSVVAAGDRVYVLTDAGDLHAFGPTDGERLWTTPVAESNAHLTATREGAYLHYSEGRDGTTVTAIRRDGESGWKTELPINSSFGRGVPVAANGALYAVADHTLVALAREDGTVRWSREIEGIEGPLAVADGTVYCTGRHALHALDTADGGVRWRFESLRRRGITSPPGVGDGAVYVGAGESLYSVASGDGSTRWQVESGQVTTRPLVVDSTVVVATREGVVRGHWRE